MGKKSNKGNNDDIYQSDQVNKKHRIKSEKLQKRIERKRNKKKVKEIHHAKRTLFKYIISNFHQRKQNIDLTRLPLDFKEIQKTVKSILSQKDMDSVNRLLTMFDTMEKTVKEVDISSFKNKTIIKDIAKFMRVMHVQQNPKNPMKYSLYHMFRKRDPKVRYTTNVDDLLKADVIILPGTKSTLHDLYELRRNGCAQAIVRAHRDGATVLGICGGYQLMGVEVCDPGHVEGDVERLPGLGLLPVTTTMSGEKLTRQVTTQYGPGYEIHMGETLPFGQTAPSPLLHLADGRDDGYLADRRCMGTYVHGILDNAAFVDFLLEPFAEKLAERSQPFDYVAYKERQYDLLADHVRRHLDMQRLYQILTDE